MINNFLQKNFLLLVLIFSQLTISNSSGFTQPKREVRAVWITTNYQLDWPPKSFNPDIQKKSLIEILDNLKSKNFNTIFFQVRAQGTTFYKSNFEPWSQYLTGTLGLTPSYDPLQFILDEAHKRGLEVHAWINMINVKSGDSPIQITNPPHIVLARPEWVRKYKEDKNVSYWLDPGFPEAREYLKSLCLEIVTNYNVDGIHLDYIRYPGTDFDDSLSYEMYGKGKTKEDFRRENINSLISSIYDAVTSIKPMLKVGSAPIGIYENIAGARGLQGKHHVFQDSREWLRRKKHDYIVPQIYWDINSEPKFDLLVEDWVKNNYGRFVIIGIGAYNQSVLNEIEKQIEITRKLKSAGQSFFRYENIKDLNFESYKFKANIPPMKWKDSIPPNPPYSLSGKNIEGKTGLIELVWGIPLRAIDGDSAKYYNVYRGITPQIDRDNPTFILASTSNYFYYDFIRRPSQLEYYYQVSSFDKNHNESLTATEIVKVELTNLKEILKPIYPKNIVAFQLLNNVGRVILELDKLSNAIISLHDKNGNKLKDISSTQLQTGMNLIEFEIPPSRQNDFILKISLPDRVEIVEFKK
ncbi:MAG: family 10 glycosylhydrolase [Ignavibacteria bacterium]|nr:family 10 glycosylhydrolase [Ignavibacteria bacterium]